MNILEKCIIRYSDHFKLLYANLVLYPSPSNLSYFWNFGSLAIYALLIQIFSGLLLALWYVPSIEMAFQSVEYIVREVDCGWLLRNVHANGASFFFFVVYCHIIRGIYYGSYVYPREKVWYSGIIIFVLMIATAFFGYVLPFGQMSYWAATVIFSLTSVIPTMGKNILLYLWGGISIEQPTLSRIYALHFILPFIILAMAASHLILLHDDGSNNPVGVDGSDLMPFHPYYTYKDIVGVVVSSTFAILFIFFNPNYTIHSDNYIMANPDVTPAHIVPEWYFLPFYGILRSVPNKTGGVLLLAAALLLLFLIPLMSMPIVRSGKFRPLFQYIFYAFAITCLLLGWSGGKPIATPYYEICQAATTMYFMFFLLLNPIIVYMERLVLPVECDGIESGIFMRTIRMIGEQIRELKKKFIDLVLQIPEINKQIRKLKKKFIVFVEQQSIPGINKQIRELKKKFIDLVLQSIPRINKQIRELKKKFMDLVRQLNKFKWH